MPNSTSQGRTLPDGIFGPETANRVRSFQTANGLVADAIIGPLPMAALERAIIAQSTVNRRADANKARRHGAAVR
jgi:peptidoglycan hydrolase-like protein with peptidoglycan-binding domain